MAQKKIVKLEHGDAYFWIGCESNIAHICLTKYNTKEHIFPLCDEKDIEPITEINVHLNKTIYKMCKKCKKLLGKEW